MILAPLSIKLEFENMGVLALSEQGLPFAMINLHKMPVNVERDERSRMNIWIGAADLSGSYFNVEDGFLVGRKMLGSLHETHKTTLEGSSTDFLIEEIIRTQLDYTNAISMKVLNKERKSLSSPQNESPRLANEEAQVAHPLEVEIEMNPNGNKEIHVNLKQLKIYLVTATYFSLLGFVSMDDSVSPVPAQKVSGKNF